jgi:hypothetical protein
MGSPGNIELASPHKLKDNHNEQPKISLASQMFIYQRLAQPLQLLERTLAEIKQKIINHSTSSS